MELQQLRYVIAVAETGSFTAAARRCHVTQPSLSQQVKKLESELGLVLIERGRRARLTAAGETLLPRMRAAIAAVCAARREARVLAGETITR